LNMLRCHAQTQLHCLSLVESALALQKHWKFKKAVKRAGTWNERGWFD
jgi:hypothetical protein